MEQSILDSGVRMDFDLEEEFKSGQTAQSIKGFGRTTWLMAKAG
jgi:hypothetical protein